MSRGGSFIGDFFPLSFSHVGNALGGLFGANMLDVHGHGHGHGNMGRSGTGRDGMCCFTLLFLFTFACWRKILGNGRTISCMWAEFEIYKRRLGRSYRGMI